MSNETICREHHFNNWGGRCRICAIQERYYFEAMAALVQWPESDKKTENYTRTLNSLKCKPHMHKGDGL